MGRRGVAPSDGVAWANLSAEAIWTVARVAIPLALGFKQREISKDLGVSVHVLRERLDALREEIVSLGPPSDEERRWMDAEFGDDAEAA
jgi:hypothetical protein